MSVLLVEPLYPGRFSQSPSDFTNLVNRELILSPPLGLGYLAAILQKENIPVDGINLNSGSDPSLNLLNKISKNRPKIIGISVNFTVATNRILMLVRFIKKTFPDIVLVAGGHHATFRYAELLKAGFDAVVLFEGGKTFLELVKHVLNQGLKDLEKIKGIGFLDKEEAIYTGRPAAENLDELPSPSLNLFLPEKSGLFNTYPLLTSSGCSMNCYFCAVPAFCQGKIRTRHPQNVKKEIEEAISGGYHNFAFTDDNFSFSKERVVQICEILENLNITWGANCHLETLDGPTLEVMRKAGCQQIRIGVESGSDEVLPKIKQRLTKNKILNFVENTRQAKIDLICGFMFPHYLDTLETAEETKNFMRQLASAGALINLYLTTPFPGTSLCENAKQLKVKIFDQNWDHYDTLTPTFETPWLNREQINQKFREMQDIVIELTVETVIRILNNNPDLKNLSFDKKFLMAQVREILKR